MKKIYLLLIAIITFAISGFAQITVTGGTGAAGTYTTLGGAIVAINGGGALTAPVVVDVVAGHKDTLTGSILLTMTGTAANTITIQKSGAGANPIITSYTGIAAATSGVAVIDGMFILQGSDYVTIDGIDLQEAAANTTAATQMEVGYGLFKTSVTDGCQNVTIKNCAFSFGRASTINGASWTGSTAIASANAVWGAVSTLLIPTALSGTNSNNTFSYNTITGGSAGIQVIGYLLDLTNALCDQNNTISYNSVLDYGNATTNSVHGIIISGQVGFLVNNNIVASSSTSKHAGTINGIFNANGGVGGDGIISYNLVTVHGGGTTTHTQGIRVQSGTSTATITIANNKVYNSTHTTSTTGSFFGILVTGNAGTYNIINDTITNNNIVGSATYSGIISLISVTTGTPTNVNIMGNSITNNSNLNGTLITATGAVRVMDVSVGTNVLIRDNTIDGYTRQNSVSTSTVGNLAGIYCAGGGSAQCFVKHNTVNNIVYNGAGTGSPIVGIGTGASANLVVDSNTVTNLTNNKTTGTSIIYGIYDGSAVPIANYNYNVVSNLTSAGPTTMYGMNFATGAGTRTVSNNLIHTISSSGSTVTGMLQSQSTPTIFNNKIYNISSSSITNPTVSGITVSSVSATGATIYNNYIGDLKAPSATSTSALSPSVRGINISAATALSTFNVYYNTIHLNASSSGTLFATAGVFHTQNTTATTAALNLVNNIIVNNSTPVGTGNSVAFQRSASTDLNNYATTSNNNLFYAGTPGANNLIYFDGTIGYQTLATFQALVTTRETASVTENPNFISLVGSSADFLHLNTTNCAMDGKGIPIAGITTDYDLQSRDAVAPDMGADEFTSTAGNTLYNSVGTTVTDIRTITATETYRASNCERFAVLQPNGASPVSGSVTARVYKYATVQTYNAEPYVQRVIDITPATNAATATGRVTLYYTQLEFDDYNTASGAWPDLPTGAGDATGIANLRITKYGGTPNVTPSLPNQYSGGANEYINPADVDIVWNATDNRWEITLDITGFSGFYIHTNPNFALPIVVNYLQGTKQGGSHNLNWKVTCASSSSATMVLERSADNRNFAAINTVTADALRCAQPFNYVDASPLAGVNYYRLRITDANGKVTYSNTIALVNKLSGVEIVGIAPNPVTSAGAATLNVASAQQGTLKIVVTDLAGRQLITQTEKIIAGSNQIPMNFAKLSGGSYQVTAITEDGKATSVRFIKQ